MAELADVAPTFVDMAHRIVWATVATVDTEGRARTRILHPIWEWDSAALVGWIATDPTSPKGAHLAHKPVGLDHVLDVRTRHLHRRPGS